MWLSISSFVISVASVALSLVAICTTVRLSRRAEESLRKSKKVAALTTGQVLQAFQDLQRPDDFEIIKAGAPVWDMTQIAYLIKPGGTVEFTVEKVASGDSPLDKDEVDSLRLVVFAPSRRHFRTKGLKGQLLDDFHCEWRVHYPDDFQDAPSDEEGLYSVYCSVPDGNYKSLSSSFFVLE